MVGSLNTFAFIVTALLLAECFWPFKIPGVEADALFFPNRSLPVFMWLAIMSIYFFRYIEHTKAGLADKTEE